MSAIHLIPLRRMQSEKIYEQACHVAPGGVHSPVRAFSGLKQTALIAESGKGDTLFDVDGFAYIDYCCSWGALIHGHAHEGIIHAAIETVKKGSSFGVTTPLEPRLASLMIENVPWMEKIRFVSSGTEATMSAVRVARGYTGRNLIIKFAGNYHGHSDAFLVQAGSGLVGLPYSSSAGVPSDFVKHTLCLPYNDLSVLKKAFLEHGKEIAAVIIEPIAANMGVVEPCHAFLETVRQECDREGALLIFDEVITGFRIALGGAAEYFGIVPDLGCFGKIIGGGFPSAAFGGKAEIMDVLAPLGSVYQAGTLSGNPAAMAAGFQAISLCMEKDFYQKMKIYTDIVTQPIKEWISKKGCELSLQQAGSLFTIFFGKKKINNLDDAKGCDIERFNQFFQYLFQRGVYIAPSQFGANFLSSVHTMEHLLYTRDCMLEALESLF
jgi:glutamate-1-semialdehyde 2,1-aminomutase